MQAFLSKPDTDKKIHMNTDPGRKWPFALVWTLLFLSIVVDNCWIVPLIPWESRLAGVSLMPVFLDIPASLPFVIDPLPVGVLFSIFYFIVLLSRHPRGSAINRADLHKRVKRVLAGLSAMAGCLLAGGFLYSLCSELLSRKVRNGIDSFGIQATIQLPFPDQTVIHLRGSMILLVCFIMGVRVFNKMIRVTVKPSSGAICGESSTNGKAVASNAVTAVIDGSNSDQGLVSVGTLVANALRRDALRMDALRIEAQKGAARQVSVRIVAPRPVILDSSILGVPSGPDNKKPAVPSRETAGR
jgi:hypothetical protein